jgi:hypothetical protein
MDALWGFYGGVALTVSLYGLYRLAIMFLTKITELNVAIKDLERRYEEIKKELTP